MQLKSCLFPSLIINLSCMRTCMNMHSLWQTGRQEDNGLRLKTYSTAVSSRGTHPRFAILLSSPLLSSPIAPTAGREQSGFLGAVLLTRPERVAFTLLLRRLLVLASSGSPRSSRLQLLPPRRPTQCKRMHSWPLDLLLPRFGKTEGCNKHQEKINLQSSLQRS